MLECSTCRVKCLFRVSGCELPVVQSAFVNLPTVSLSVDSRADELYSNK